MVVQAGTMKCRGGATLALLFGFCGPAAAETWTIPPVNKPAFVIAGPAERYGIVPTRGQPPVPISLEELRRDNIRAFLVIDGEAQAGEPTEDAIWFTLPVDRVGTRRMHFRIQDRDGITDGPMTSLEVLPDVFLKSPPVVDFGTIPVGCDPESHCQALDLSASRNAGGVPITLSRLDQETDSADLALTLHDAHGSEVIALGGTATRTLGDGESLRVCLVPRACVPVPEDLRVELRLSPVDARLSQPERLAAIALTASATRRTWLSCNLWWILPTIGGLIFAWIVWGFLKPHSFRASTALRVAPDLRALGKAPPRPIRSVAGGRRGFYRHAACRFDESGHTVTRRASHVVQLEAGPAGQVLIRIRGAEVCHKVRGAWRPLGASEASAVAPAFHVLASGESYRVGSTFYFRVDV